MNIQSLINNIKINMELNITEKILGGIYIAFTSMMIVFLMLLFISFIISVIGKLNFNKIKNRNDEVNTKINSTLDYKDECIDKEEILAIIMACVYDFKSSDCEIVVRKIKRSENMYKKWNDTLEG